MENVTPFQQSTLSQHNSSENYFGKDEDSSELMIWQHTWTHKIYSLG